MCVDLSFLVLSFSYEVKLQSSEQIKDVAKEPSKIEIIPKSEAQQSNQQSKTSTSSAREQELDVFLLGGESDEDPGELPNVFGNLTNLQFFIANSNFFSGPFLLSLALCSKLHVLDLRNNSLTGSIDLNFTGLPSLGIGYCGLKGHIPVWLSSCKKLHVLDLSWNHLDGRIPPWISSMENLFYLDLSNNSLIGEIPTNLTEIKSLISTNCCSSNLTSAAGIPLFVKRTRNSNDHKIEVQDLKIFCKCKLKSGDEYEDVCAGTLDAFADLRHGIRYIGSDDLVYMGFNNRMYPRDVGDNNEASFQFCIGPHYNGKRREDCKLKKCGVRLLYTQDHGEFNGSFSSVKEEDETRPQPKRLKLMEFH
ncbi:hypothetical protein Q3G72_000337 [Acer saccharum]|nr:hypothetical protein Q3G72_000337 [Acer saccharum]